MTRSNNTVVACLLLGLATTGCGLVIDVLGDSDGSEEEATVANTTAETVWLVSGESHRAGQPFLEIDGRESGSHCLRAPRWIEVHTEDPDGMGETPEFTVDFGDRAFCSGTWEWDGTTLAETADG